MNNRSQKALIFIALLCGIDAADAQTATVGASNDSQCDFTSIQAAIDSPTNYNRIHVAAGPENNRITYNENLSITRALVLQGGYDDCAAAASGTLFIDSPQTYLQGTGTGPVIFIQNTGAVDIYRFEITGGNGNLGGAVESRNSASTRLLDSLVVSNSANLGGAVYVQRDSPPGQFDVHFELRNTLVLANTAHFDGGGVYCQNVNMRMDEDSGVSLNQSIGTDSKGGGIYMADCDLQFFAGTTLPMNPVEMTSYRGISGNQATGHGGGVYATGSSLSFLGGRYDFGQNVGTYGRLSVPVLIRDNTADSDANNVGNGGGIYIEGQFLNFSFLEFQKAHITGNSGYRGGGLFIGDNTQAYIGRLRPFGGNGEAGCWDDGIDCNRVEGNRATLQGGALYLQGGLNLTASQTHFLNNRADDGTVLYADSTGASQEIKLHQNLMVHNGRDGFGGYSDDAVISLYNNSDIVSGNTLNASLMFDTIADNHATQAVLNTEGVLIHLDVLTSIVHDPSSPKVAEFNGAFHSMTFDCVNMNETTSINEPFVTSSRLSADNPGFFWRNHDYHINRTSAMVDYCDNSMTGGAYTTNDIDDDTRAVNVEEVPNFHGAWDLGADESTGEVSDYIYVDSFDW